MPESAFVKTMAAQICAAILFLMSGCAAVDSSLATRAAVSSWARDRGFEPAPLRAGAFELFALSRVSASSESLTIYIEGDGAPWGTPYHPPRDPTPREPVALTLAAADGARNVAWIARPCQYLSDAELSRCGSEYWTGRRFAPEVIEAYDDAVTRLKVAARARDVKLAGYSGGGVIAVLVAMRRKDVALVMSVAAPLSLSDWVARHGLSPLSGSLDPAAQRPASRDLPGIHFAGANDTIVPPGIIERFVQSHGGRLETVAGFDHNCCWARDWRRLLSRAEHVIKGTP
jgi:hypothetical protein